MTKVFAHRGFSGAYPENTLLAFRKAQETGADGIELDVHLSRDGELVIIHDELLDRTTTVRGYVKERTAAELGAMDASASYSGQCGFNPIPTLRQYFELIADDAAFLTNIELKTGVFEYPGIEAKVLALLDEFHRRDTVIISSFNHYSVKRMQALAPDMVTAFLEESWILDFGAYAERHGVDCVHPYYPCLTPETVAEMRQHGRRINTWTVNETSDMQALLALGVDGLISNFPDRARALLPR